MIGAKIYAAASTTISTFTVGASVAASSTGSVPPTNIPFIGPVPVFAVAVGSLTVILVREITKANDKSKLWSYNLAVTLLALVGTATFIIDHQVGPGNSFWVGGAFGAAGAGTVSIMQSQFFTAIISGLRSGFLKGISPAAPTPPTDDAPKSE